MLLIRSLSLGILPLFGLAGKPLFFASSDRFADCVKVALAQLSITMSLGDHVNIAQWPQLFQRYYFYNDYLELGATVQHLPPLSTLIFLGIAKLLFYISPVAIVGVMVSIYTAGSLILGHLIERLSGKKILAPSFMLICLTYPSLFMIDRGNFHSGATSLLVIFYMFSAYYRRWRLLGWLALALAVNIRPNICIFGLLEFGRDRELPEVARSLAGLALMSLIIGASSLTIASQVDPTYSLRSFINSYAWYEANYVEGVHGLAWNLSLLNAPKLASVILGYANFYDSSLATGLTLLGGAFVLLFFGFYAARRVEFEQFAFVLAAACSIFTPVFGEYHALIFVGPLLLLILNRPKAIPTRALWWGSGSLIALQAVCLAFDVLGTAWLMLPIASISVAFPLLARRALASDEIHRVSSFVMTMGCMAALSPLGGEWSNGIAVSFLLLSTLLWGAWRSVGRTFSANAPHYVVRRTCAMSAVAAHRRPVESR
jgi:hypothetical protein